MENLGWNDHHTKITKERVDKLIELGKIKTIEDNCPYCGLPVTMCKSWDWEVAQKLEGGRYY